MPRHEYVIRVLVSSPSDVAEERQLLEDLVRELNATWSRQLGLRLELVRWETDVLPGVGAEPQAVIDAAIGDDYDAFVGLLWKRFGTPTATHGSGTAQEFERAFARAQTDPSLGVMFYFSDTAVSPSELDPSQLAQVRSFRESIGPRGVLWTTYKDRSEFVQLLRLHLSKLAQDWQARLAADAGRAPAAAPSPPLRQSPPKIEEQAEEEGLLDLTELVQEDIASLTATAERIAQAITDVGNQMNAGSEALNALHAAGEADPGRLKRVINRTAEDVEAFAKRIDTDVPILATVYERMVGAVARAAVIQADFKGPENPLPAAIAAAETLVAHIRSAKEGAEGMRAAASAWPRMSTALNRAKRRALDALDKLIAEFQRNIDVTEAVIKSLKGRLP